MDMLDNIIAVFLSNVYIVLLKLRGRHIKGKLLSILSPKVSVYTKNKGSILIGEKSCIRPYTELSSKGGILKIGNQCYVNRGCLIASHEEIIIEDGVTIGPGTYIYDHDHDGKGGYTTKPVKIEEGVWIGAGCIILKGVTIEKGSIVAAGSVICKDVPNDVMVVQKKENQFIQRTKK